ncbi:hypothetical protein FGO68_gene13799 [Halteria grandinella]|uniref:TRP C-terminal domain-containing protein n=1 Tax=Halteria grandinella TaxID=5974 RepID=A0A8J8SXN4_HALGN|nr:hypothetical protein FGO68_gene13799 [Halteria grandinella]
MWGMLENLRRLTSLSIISVKLPVLTSLINKYLLQFSQMDILPADKIEEYFLVFDEISDESLGPSFEGAGFDSRNALRNLGSGFLYIIISLMYCSLIFFAKLVNFSSQGYFSVNVFSFLRKVINSSYQQIFWSLPLRMIMQQYFIYSISAFSNTQIQINYSTSGEQLASATSLAMMGIAFGAPLFAAIIIFFRHSLVDFSERFGTLTEGLSEQGLYNTPIELIHTLVSIVIYIYLRQTAGIQITLLYFISLLKQAYIIFISPYERPIDNKIALLNELILSAYLMTIMFFTDANGNTDILHICDFVLLSIASLVAALGPMIVKVLSYLKSEKMPEDYFEAQTKNNQKYESKLETKHLVIMKAVKKNSKMQKSKRLVKAIIKKIKGNGKKKAKRVNEITQVESICAIDVTNNNIDNDDNYCYRIDENNLQLSKH